MEKGRTKVLIVLLIIVIIAAGGTLAYKLVKDKNKTQEVTGEENETPIIIRDAGLPRQADELRQHDLVFFEAVVLQFDVIVALAEQVPIPQRCLLGAVIVPCQNRAGYLARQAGGKNFTPHFEETRGCSYCKEKGTGTSETD